MIDIDGHDIMLTATEKSEIKSSDSRCPFLNIAPIIPLANKFYGYCSIRDGRLGKRSIDKAYLYSYCINESIGLAFISCPIWKGNDGKK